MRLSRIIAVARKETLHLTRDKRSLYLALGIPLMLIIMFGYALSLDVDEIPLAVWDQDRTPQSRELIDRLTSSGYFKLVFLADSYDQIVQAMDERRITLGVTIPWNFAKSMRKSGGTTVQAAVDASDSVRAGIAISYFNVIVGIYRTDTLASELNRQAVTKLNVPVEPRIRLLYNPELQSRINIIPGLIAIIMMVIGALMTSQTVVREKETGTLEQLISTPVKPPELIVGKLIPYFVLGYLDLIMVYLMSQYVFDVPFRGSLVLMFLLSGVFLIGALSLGLLISAAAETQLFATQFALLGTFLPSFLLSGFVFPISNMPYIIQFISYLVPARYYVQILRGIFLKGVGIEILLVPVLLMTLFGFVTTVLASRRLGKRLHE
ncbi:ABC transporter permease [Thermodesulfobacteriota bacterium]